MEDENEKTPLMRENEVELTGCGATAACDPRRPVHKYLVLIVMCFLSFGSYFCYDNPAALQDQMKEDLDISTSQFMNFYAWYSWPNVVLCFFGGFLIDRVFGIRWGGIIFAGFVTAGQLVFALGALLNSYWTMNMGRLIFGIGGESLCVAQNTYAVNWFKGKELNMVFGLQLSFSRVGSTVNMNVMHPIYNAIDKTFDGHTTLGISLFIASIFCVFSLMCALLMAFFDKRATRILRKDEAKSGEVIRFRDVKDFPPAVWLLCVICVAYYVTVFPFIGLGLGRFLTLVLCVVVGVVFFESKFDMEPSSANAVNSLVYIISAIASPVFGFCIDKTGRNIFWVFAGCLITLGCHATLAFTFINPYVAMSVMGLAYSILASALWPMVAIIVPEYQLGTAYGIMQSFQNLGLGVVSVIAGIIVDQKGYLVLEVFFLMWLCLALIACAVLYIYDNARGGMFALIACAVLYIYDNARGGELNRSAAQRRKVLIIESEINSSINVPAET